MEGKSKCCCWGVGNLTKSIGWFQVVSNFCMLIIVPLCFDRVNTMKEEEFLALPTINIKHEEYEAIKPYIPVVFGVYLIIIVMKLVVAMILLKGAYRKNPVLLECWTHYSYLIFVFELFSATIQGIVTDGAAIGPRLVILFCEVIAYDFFTLIVDRHRKEIYADWRRRQASNVL